MSHNRIVECACHSIEHMIVFSWWPGDDEVYVYFHLDADPFPQRLWNAIKYIFGHRCNYGCFDEIVLNEAGAKELKGLLDGFLESVPKLQR